MHLVGFIANIYHNAQSSKCQRWSLVMEAITVILMAVSMYYISKHITNITVSVVRQYKISFISVALQERVR
jgi:uncharacterized membrane protein